MDPETEELSRLKTFLTRAHTSPLIYAPRAPLVPTATEYANPWPVYDELRDPPEPRTLRQVRRFEETGQRVDVNAHSFLNNLSESIYIDWSSKEVANIKLPAPGIAVMSAINYERLKVEDCNSFTLAVYTSVVVTAMECIRIMQNIGYPISCRFERKLEYRAARGAQWDILVYYSQKPVNTKTNKLAVIPLPPWSFSRLDMEEFVTPGIFNKGTLDFPRGSLRSSNAMTLWAVVHDVCTAAGCEYFIVTTYDYWVFGNMSERKTTAAVSKVFDFSEHNEVLRTPNLLQLVTYWGLLALGDEKGWELPSETPGFIVPH